MLHYVAEVPDFFETYERITRSIPTRSNDYRIGQYVFNQLYKIRPDVANKIRGTIADPYYWDDADWREASNRGQAGRVYMFWYRVIDLWEEV